MGMLRKVIALLASKCLAIKVRMRAIETHLAIQSLLLRDKKMVRHLFRQRKCFNLSNKVKDEDEYQPEGIVVLEEDNLPESIDAQINGAGSVDATHLINNSIATTPASVVQVAKEAKNKMERDEAEEDECPELRRCVFEDERGEVECVSVIEMAKNAKEGRGKKFVLEDDIDRVADLFIQRFHQQIHKERYFD